MIRKPARLEGSGSSKIGNGSISFSAQFITSVSPIKCSTACRRALNNLSDATLIKFIRTILGVSASGLVDCLAHLDLVKIHGHRPRTPVAELVDETLELIRSRGLAIELSTAGWRKPVKELYPSDEIISLAIEKKIPFTVASDAHSWAQLGENYERLAEKLNALGICEICVYEKHERRPVMTNGET